MLTTVRNQFCVVFRNRCPLWAFFLHISRGNEKRDFKGKRLNFIPAISSDRHGERDSAFIYSFFVFVENMRNSVLYIRRNTKKEKMKCVRNQKPLSRRLMHDLRSSTLCATCHSIMIDTFTEPAEPVVPPLSSLAHKLKNLTRTSMTSYGDEQSRGVSLETFPIARRLVEPLFEIKIASGWRCGRKFACLVSHLVAILNTVLKCIADYSNGTQIGFISG